MRNFALVLALAGCGDAPSCQQAFDKASKQLDTPRAQFARMARECERGGYSADTRRCVSKVDSLDDFEACLVKEPAFIGLQQKEEHEAKLAAERAEKAADDALKAAQTARDSVQQIQKDVDDLAQKVNAATDALASAQNDADRAAAKAKLEQLRKDRAEIEARAQAARDAAERAERVKGVKISKECMDNPLAAGCN